MAKNQKTKICMIVPDPMVTGGIAAVTSGYYGSRLEADYDITYVESYCDGSKWKKLGKALKAYVAFHRVLRTNRPDIVHIHSSFGPSFFRKMPFIQMSVRRGIPVVNHIHGSAFEEFYLHASARKQKLVRKIYGKCARIIVLTDAWKERLSCIVPAEKITVVRNYGTQHPELLSKETLAKRFQGKKILFLGVITEGKGLYEMPAVITAVAKQVPEAVFIIAGLGDDQYLKEHLPQEIYERNVVLPGWVRDNEKKQYLEESMLFFLPTHMEAMPMSILEAEGYGLPVVSTNVGGVPFTVDQHASGELVPLKDTEAMAAAILRYLDDEEKWKRASAAAEQLVEERFSLEQHLMALERIYQEVL